MLGCALMAGMGCVCVCVCVCVCLIREGVMDGGWEVEGGSSRPHIPATFLDQQRVHHNDALMVKQGGRDTGLVVGFRQGGLRRGVSRPYVPAPLP
jgi:hypothetical protein